MQCRPKNVGTILRIFCVTCSAVALLKLYDMGKLQRIRRLSRLEARLLVQALLAVVRVRFYLLREAHHELRRLIESYGHSSVKTDVPRADLAEIAWSVRNAARLIPGATCLTQASAGQLLLAQRGYASTIRLSVPARAAVPDKLAPHAWLIASNTIVLGGTPADYAQHQALHDFTVLGASKT